ncbi:MAG: hypothetical protein ACPGYV_02520 [Phycisphaeraceae bacterium]
MPVLSLTEAIYRPPFALVIVFLVAVAALVGLCAAYRRERALWPALLRGAGIVGVVWVLLGYSLTQPGTTSPAESPRLAILIDTSESMAQADAPRSPAGPPRTRLEAVRQAYLGENQLAEFRRVAEVELIAFDDRLRPADPDRLAADGQATALDRAIAQTRADATLVLSDGHDTSTAKTAAADFVDAGRLFAFPVGTPRSAPDLSLQAWAESDRVFEDQSTTITASIDHRGMDERTATVELKRDGETIDTQPLSLDRTSQTVAFRVTPPLDPGRTTQANLYSLSVRLDDGEEAYPDNNRQDVVIQTSRGRLRVLVLEGEPYWDTRSLARLVAGHPRFDLTAVYAFGSERSTRVLGETIDRSVEPLKQLDRFDIVVLGRAIERVCTPAFVERLPAFTRGGGSVVYARGRPTDPTTPVGQRMLSALEPISPVRWGEPVLGEMRVRLTEGTQTSGPLGDLRDGEVLSRLPGMLAATRIDGRKSASLVMLEQRPDTGPPMAALTSLRVGEGVSLAVLTEGLWRWELLPGVDEADPRIESAFGLFWVRALQWLASGGAFLPGQDIAIQADRLAVEPNQPVTLRISTRYIETQDLGLTLSVVAPNGGSQTLTPRLSATPGTYTAGFTPGETGVYSFALNAPGRADLIDPAAPLTTRVVAVDRSPERRDTSAKPQRLRQLVEPSGGVCLTSDDPGPLIDYLQSLQALRGRDAAVDYAFNTWLIFAMIAGCFGLEWVVRRRSGLR